MLGSDDPDQKSKKPGMESTIPGLTLMGIRSAFSLGSPFGRLERVDTHRGDF